MKGYDFLLLIFLAVTSLAVPSYAKKPAKEQKPPITSINKGHEWLKALGHGASAITLIAASYQLYLAAQARKVRFAHTTSSDDFYGPFSYCASTVAYISLVRLACNDARICLEALKKAFNGYVITPEAVK